MFDTFTFECRQRYNNDQIETWSGKIRCVRSTNELVEFMVSGKGSEYYAILGKCKFGNYLCLPSIGTGCYISEFQDRFWNLENLSYYINYVDAVTITTGIYHIEKIWYKA